MNNTPQSSPDVTPDDHDRYAQLVVVLIPETLDIPASHRFLACQPVATPADVELDSDQRAVYEAVSGHREPASARRAAAADGTVVVERGHGRYNAEAVVAERTDGRDSCDFYVVEDVDVEALEHALEDMTCRRCGQDNRGGDGWDGLCGACADVAEATGTWDEWR